MPWVGSTRNVLSRRLAPAAHPRPPSRHPYRCPCRRPGPGPPDRTPCPPPPPASPPSATCCGPDACEYHGTELVAPESPFHDVVFCRPHARLLSLCHTKTRLTAWPPRAPWSAAWPLPESRLQARGRSPGSRPAPSRPRPAVPGTGWRVLRPPLAALSGPPEPPAGTNSTRHGHTALAGCAGRAWQSAAWL